MRVSHGAPSHEVRTPRFVAPPPTRTARINLPKPKRVVNRAPWQPNNSKNVLLVCGHVSMAWPLIHALKPLGPAVHCDTCGEWISIWRDATAAEAAGIETGTLYEGEDPPF